MNITQSQSTLTQLENDAARARFEQGQKQLGSSKLDKNAFLQLLLAQLKFQDPMNPVEDQEFISQQAQFTQIEKLDELTKAIGQGNQIAQASNMVGKSVEVIKEDGTLTTGRVDSVSIGADGTVALNIGDELFLPTQITQIFAD